MQFAQNERCAGDGAWRKDIKMNPHITLKEAHESTIAIETASIDIDTLTRYGYSADEIASLLWLRQRYQNGGSDRAALVHYLEFLKHLVRSSRLDA